MQEGAPEVMAKLLDMASAEVRAGAVFALGALIQVRADCLPGRNLAQMTLLEWMSPQ